MGDISELVSNHSLLEAIRLYLRATSKSARQVSLEMGRSATYLSQLRAQVHVYPGTERKLFHYFHANWPAHHAMPSLISDFMMWEGKASKRKPKALAAKSMRACMCCKSQFESNWIGNRLCKSCSGTASRLGAEYT